MLEKRTFQRLGETQARGCEGKIVAATHRDLIERIDCGAFREDLYYRLCGHRITTPTLRAQLDDTPGQLHDMLLFIAAKVAKEEMAESLAGASERWIKTQLPPDYPWPGNVRELGQCVRNVMMCQVYRPDRKGKAPYTDPELHRKLDAGELTAEEVLRYYLTRVHAQTGSLRETARRSGLDRRTVMRKIDQELLARLKLEERGGEGEE